ncbi:hypothetical protein A2U01_0085536, partial [Trifolium medium]|nr:hypothetical protein [Trifolium medium]
SQEASMQETEDAKLKCSFPSIS